MRYKPSTNRWGTMQVFIWIFVEIKPGTKSEMKNCGPYSRDNQLVTSVSQGFASHHREVLSSCFVISGLNWFNCWTLGNQLQSKTSSVSAIFNLGLDGCAPAVAKRI